MVSLVPQISQLQHHVLSERSLNAEVVLLHVTLPPPGGLEEVDCIRGTRAEWHGAETGIQLRLRGKRDRRGSVLQQQRRRESVIGRNIATRCGESNLRHSRRRRVV